MAKYKKKRVRELQHDRFRDTTMLLADKLADRVAGRGRQILYGLLALIVLAAAVYGVVRWRGKHSDEAEAAMGRAITINGAEISLAPVPGSRRPLSTRPIAAINCGGIPWPRSANAIAARHCSPGDCAAWEARSA